MHTGASPDSELINELMYLAPVGVVQMDLAGNVRLINPIAVRILMPLTKKGDQLTNLFSTLEPVAPELKGMVTKFQHQTGTIVRDYRIMNSSGLRSLPDSVFYTVSILKIGSDSLMLTFDDISTLVQRERLLNKQEAWINLIGTGVECYALAVLDQHGYFSSWNPALKRIVGYDAAQLIGQSYSLLYPSDAITLDRITDRLFEVDSTGVSFDEGWMRRADGSMFWGHTVITPVEKSIRERSYSMLVRDISESRQTMESLLKAASSDQLTGLSNRRAFYEAAELELARFVRKPRPISLLIRY